MPRNVKTMSKINKSENQIKNEEIVKKIVNQTKKTALIPKGKPKSGRTWKNEKQRFNSIIKTKGIRNSFETKQKLRQQLQRIKETSRAIINEKKVAKEEKKQRRRENIKRREENRLKSEVVQVITNTRKIKQMKRKQLKNIEKRDTNNLIS